MDVRKSRATDSAGMCKSVCVRAQGTEHMAIVSRSQRSQWHSVCEPAFQGSELIHVKPLRALCDRPGDEELAGRNGDKGGQTNRLCNTERRRGTMRELWL